MDNSDFIVMYNDHDKQILRVAEESLDPHLDRIQEIIEYSKEAV